MSKKYLTKLPPKTSKVAPGDVVGGMIYMMDKPVGVEPGMIGISVDSPSYIAFVKEQLALLEQNEHPTKQLQSRFNQHIKKTKGFQALSQEEKIKILLEDKVHIERRYPLKRKDLKRVFLSTGKFHEVNSWQKYYENVGTGGLLFHSYKDKLKIHKNDHFASQIQKFIDDGNKAYMVKQDGKMVFGRTGPDTSRLLKTEVGRKLQLGANPFVAIATAGLSALGFAAGILGWRALILKQNTPKAANSAAIVEEVATKLANIRGFNSQEIEIIEGTYKDGTPKIATVVTWSPGCRDLTGKLAGGEEDKTNVIVSWDQNGVHLKVDKDGNIIRSKKEMIKGKEKISYEKILENGSVSAASIEEYNQAKAVSEHRIAGLGESLISFISMGDRDGIGEVGQNKVILPLKPPQGDCLYQFFGIDFGKAYEGPNPIIDSLSDDFSIINPTNRKSRFLNISILYDTSLSDKMKGVYLLAVLRNKLSDEEKEKVAAEYEANGDKSFADKLRAYPESLFEKYGDEIGLDLKGDEADKLMHAQQIKRWIKNGDLWWIKNEENKYRELARNEAENKELQKHYLSYADKLSTVYTLAKHADNKVLDAFSKRIKLTPSQIDILENIEKLTAHRLHALSPDGKVQLNHLRVDREDRVPWQLTTENGKFALVCEDTKNIENIKSRLALLNNDHLASKIKTVNNILKIEDLSQEDLNMLHQELSEEKIAKLRDIPEFRTQAMRASFEKRLKLNKERETPIDATKPKVVVTPDDQPLLAPVITTEPHKKRRSKPVAHSYKSKQEKNPKETLVTQNLNTAENVEKFIQENQQQCAHLKVVSKNPGSLTIEVAKTGQTAPLQIFIDNDIENQSTRYAIKKDLVGQQSISDYQDVCECALLTATSNTQYNISIAPIEQRAMLQQAFDIEIAKAVQDGRFTEDAKPTVVGRVPEVSALFTVSKGKSL
ncbi:MAG: hypothetical protein HYX61_12590 [Gammaproteobacteria bacterium]|nr:hypothetical protein [Gammaproteobacteria bacterium]